MLLAQARRRWHAGHTPAICVYASAGHTPEKSLIGPILKAMILPIKNTTRTGKVVSKRSIKIIDTINIYLRIVNEEKPNKEVINLINELSWPLNSHRADVRTPEIIPNV